MPTPAADGSAASEAPGGMLHVHATLPGVGAALSVLVGEEPTRFAEFLQEAERHDTAFKRWQYVRGVQGVPGAGANIVGRLPPDLTYTGFEGYWAGSGMPAEVILGAEATLGEQELQAVARLAGVEHAWHVGLDIRQNPHAARLLNAALGRHFLLSALQELEPLFGELLAKLRATAEEGQAPDAYAAFQADVDAAVGALRPSTYLDPAQHVTLSQLVAAGRNVVGADIEEAYELPRARITKQQVSSVSLHGRKLEGYRLLSEIGRLGHPLVRALLHISDWPAGGRLTFSTPLGDAPAPGTV